MIVSLRQIIHDEDQGFPELMIAQLSTNHPEWKRSLNSIAYGTRDVGFVHCVPVNGEGVLMIGPRGESLNLNDLLLGLGLNREGQKGNEQDNNQFGVHGNDRHKASLTVQKNEHH